MSGPRRPPASRTGTGTATVPRASAGVGADVPGGEQPKRSGSTRAATTKSTSKSTMKPSTKRSSSKGSSSAKARGIKPTTARRSGAAGRDAKADDRSDRRAMDRVDGPRGRRDGLGEEARRKRLRRRARLMVGLAVTVLLVGVLFVAVLPTSTFFDQRSDAERLEARLAEIEAQRSEVGAEIERLETESEIEARARRNGYVQPGEEAYNILPTPIDPIGLPEVWPFTGVEQAMGVR